MVATLGLFLPSYGTLSFLFPLVFSGIVMNLVCWYCGFDGSLANLARLGWINRWVFNGSKP